MLALLVLWLVLWLVWSWRHSTGVFLGSCVAGLGCWVVCLGGRGGQHRSAQHSSSERGSAASAHVPPTLQDIYKPDPQRLRRHLSAVINFAKFREEKLVAYRCALGRVDGRSARAAC
jgi:hypothetical protein